jgi:NAD(P)-dependent dehydrogenase (short-subunit alcohol dehydrogenase family)
MAKSALIVGTGTGISASTARALAADGYKLTLAARRTDKLGDLARETKAHVVSADATRAEAVTALFDAAERANGPLDAVLYNASFRTRGPLIDLTPSDVEKTLMVSAFGGFLVGQEAARRMILRGAGVILFTGASASVKGYAQSAPFAMGKFALRGLAQSMARELGPKGIHVAHVVIDGGVRSVASGRVEGKDATPDSLLDPDAIAATYLHVIKQPRSAWSMEVELRPWVERF